MNVDKTPPTRVVSETVTAVKGGNLVITVVETGEDDVIIATQFRRWNGETLTRYCGWCGGREIGCVECLPSESVILDCIRGEIRCSPNGAAGWQIGGLFAERFAGNP